MAFLPDAAFEHVDANLPPEQEFAQHVRHHEERIRPALHSD
jgi:hypothetical protein